MTDHERGAYTPPTDAPLSFEGRQPVRGARPFPLTLVLSVVVLIGLAGAIFVFYRSGVRQAGPPHAVGAPVGPITTPAPPDTQPQDEAEGLQIYRSESGQPPKAAAPDFVPPPEAPQPRPQVAESAPPPAAAPTTPIASAPAPELRPAQAAPVPVPARTKVEPKPPAASPPAQSSVAHKVEPKSSAAAAPKVEPARSAPAKAGSVSAQVGAVSSPELADKTWNQAVAAAPGLAAGRGKGVEKVQVGGKTLYRTLVTGFADRAQAQAFCARLKAAGKACFVR